MKQVRAFKNDESREVIRQWCQKITDVLPFPVREQTVQTRFGSTQVVHTGPEDSVADDQPPIAILHGAITGAAFALGELCDLPTKAP
ncbi:hypothetical protein Poly51_13270 [Rubripirellula tenax]|uniref:Uncharacterized protein n=1 Tax=Rubripirellula tenax TaxID=2528015 RepID=A0A5C6FAW6_9BACT|nr:hypothetical protein Poly51_13270 [Rubripirellula tenax]